MKVTRIKSGCGFEPKRTRTAAYARVSSGKDAMLHSLAAQVSYYSKYIQSRPDLQYVGVYADEAKTGTKEERPEFQRMLTDCKDGKIDLIITKSISRFSRNTVTLLETVRWLKDLNIDVYFEEQNIHSMSGDGELLLTILASFAQEESLSVSENCKWKIRNKFKEGIPNTFSLYGYEFIKGEIFIDEEKAQVVRQIFDWYLSGIGSVKIAKMLTEQGVPSPRETIWSEQTVIGILKNVKYTGNLLLQKYFKENHLTKRILLNKGELPKYYVPNSHDPIISQEDFDKVQEMLSQHPKPESKEYELKGKVFCGICGNRYIRKNNHNKYVWRCNRYQSKGVDTCSAKQVPDHILKATAHNFDKEISKILVLPGNILKFVFYDNSEMEHIWEMPSRKWTDDMKAKNHENLRRGHQS